MPIFYKVEIQGFGELGWHDITDSIIGEVIFTEGREVDTLGGVLPNTAPSILTFTLDNHTGRFDSRNLANAIFPGAQCRLSIGATSSTGIVRFQGTLTRRDAGEQDTYTTEWVNDIWKFTGNKNQTPGIIPNSNISELWRVACILAGIPDNHISSDDFGSNTYTVELKPGKDGIIQIQELSGGIIRPRLDGGIHLERFPEDSSLKRAYYEPGGSSAAAWPIPKVRRLTAIFGVVNSAQVAYRIYYPTNPLTQEVSVPAESGVSGTSITLGRTLWGITHPALPLSHIPVFDEDRNLRLQRSSFSLEGNTPQNSAPFREKTISIQGIIVVIPPGLQVIAGGWGAWVDQWFTDTPILPELQPYVKSFQFDTDNLPSTLTFNWSWTNAEGEPWTAKLTLSNIKLEYLGLKVSLQADYESESWLVQNNIKNYTGIFAFIGGAFTIASRTTSNQGEVDYAYQEFLQPPFEDAVSIAQYGRRERFAPIESSVTLDTPLSQSYQLSSAEKVRARNRARLEVERHSIPNEVFSAYHIRDEDILARRLGDRERLNLSNGSFELFVENIETHFSGLLAWQIVYYSAGISAGIAPPPPVVIRPFTATATWTQDDLDILITDGTSNDAGVAYTIVAENTDKSQRLAVTRSSLPAPPAAQIGQARYTFTEAFDVQQVTITRQEDDYEVVILREDFLGTAPIPTTTYPDFNVFARWSNEQLIVGISELGDRTQDNYGNNEYRIIWYGGIPGRTTVTTSARGGASYTIESTFGITSLRITQIATGITKAILAKDFAGIGYTPRAFTTQWTKVSGSSSNYFYYKGWIQDNPGSSGGLAYKVAFEDVNGLTFTWEDRVVSDSTGRATPSIVGHTAAISVMIITRLIDGYTIRFPFPNVAPPTGGDDLTAYNFTATWSQRSLVLRIQERGPSEDVGGTEFRLTSSGLSTELNITRTTDALGRISYRIPDASSIQSVTATRTGDSDSVTILRKDFYGTYIAPRFTVNIQETRTNGNPDRYNYTIAIVDAAGVNTATPYRIEGTFAKFRQYINQTTSANINGVWRSAVGTSRHSQGFSNITVTRLTDNTVISIDRDNFNRKASNNPQFDVVVDENNDGTRQGIQLYSYSVLITDPSSTVGGSIYYKVQYVQGGTTLDAPEVQTGRNGEATSRFGTERTTASRVIVTRDWDGRTITVPRSSFNRE